MSDTKTEMLACPKCYGKGFQVINVTQSAAAAGFARPMAFQTTESITCRDCEGRGELPWIDGKFWTIPELQKINHSH